MGLNAIRHAEGLASFLPVSPGMSMLDLGCGMGIPPGKNTERFEGLGLDIKVIPFLGQLSKEIEPF